MKMYTKTHYEIKHMYQTLAYQQSSKVLNNTITAV